MTNNPRLLIAIQTKGFHSSKAVSASRTMKPATIIGGGAKTSGMLREMLSSPSTFHFDSPPICGECGP